MVNKILFISLSNIGDAVLSLPALDYLKAVFPQAGIKVLAGPRAKEVFTQSSAVDEFIVYDKGVKFRYKLKMFREFSREGFDLVVDLRNSLFGALLPARMRTSPFIAIPASISHMHERHLWRTRAAIKGEVRDTVLPKNFFLSSPEDEEYISALLRQGGVKAEEKIVVFSPGAKSHIKRYAAENFSNVIKAVRQEFGAKVILVGDKDDVALTAYLAQSSEDGVIDLGGRINIRQLALLLRKAQLLVTNDSATLHIASYLDLPVVAVFGPTSEAKYGPWSARCLTVKRDIFCRPCEKAQCRFRTQACLSLIRPADLLRAVRSILSPNFQFPIPAQQFRRILIVRTDRVGDVLLSTPVIKNLRDHYPGVYIAMMVSPYTKDILAGNPYLDEVILYDKLGAQKGWLGTLRFARALRKKRFDLALVLHPTNRAHLTVFLAGIRRRLGYGRRLGFLLTQRLKHTKQYGEKHERDYNLDLLSLIGISAKDKSLFMPINEQAELYCGRLFSSAGISAADKLLAIHPGASCPSKVWPAERFAAVADALSQRHRLKVIIVAADKDKDKAEDVSRNMRSPCLNLSGKTSLAQLASVLKRCALFISNDSGPVHMASALGTPVVVIFGRSQKGLSPLRWGPLGKRDRLLHKQVGCLECLAHNCQKDFACLKAISIEEVSAAAEEILQS